MEEIVIREFLDRDIAALTELYNHYIRETAITFDLQVYSPEERQRLWMEHYDRTGRHRLFIAERVTSKNAAKVVGYASSSRFGSKAAYETSVETSIYLDKDSVGYGIGSYLYKALFAALAKEDVHRAYAGITLPNEASIAIHKKFGFEQVGLYKEVGRKFDRYWDVAWFEKAMNR